MNHERSCIVNGCHELISNTLIHIPEQYQARIECPDGGNDGELQLVINDQTLRFRLSVKHIHRKESLNAYMQNTDKNQILICNVLSASLSEYCEKNRINFIDEAGNAFISTDGVYFRISGRKLKPGHLNINTKKRFTVGVMKLLFVLLTNNDAVSLTMRELAALAGISLGMASKAFNQLKSENFIRITGSGYRITDLPGLTHQWFSEYATTLRPKLGGVVLGLKGNWHDVVIREHEYWGGEVAAEQLTNHLKPEYMQLFTFNPLSQRINELKARPDAQGRFWLVPAFWGKDLKLDQKGKALLSVAELLASQDSRNYEVAKLINERYLHLTTFTPAGI